MSMSFGGNKRRWDGISLTLPAFLCYLQVLGVRVFLSPTFMVGGGERTREYELYCTKKRDQGNEWGEGLCFGTKSESLAPEQKCHC